MVIKRISDEIFDNETFTRIAKNLKKQNKKLFSVVNSEPEAKKVKNDLNVNGYQASYEKTGEYPILLLDDVFSELDLNKKINLLKYLNNDIQTIITTTEIDNIPNEIIKNATIFKLENKQIIETKEV